MLGLMGLTRLAIRRPLTVLMGILSLVLMGGVAYTFLQIDRLPPVSIGVVSVDPSSPFTHGALLGDRIQACWINPGVQPQAAAAANASPSTAGTAGPASPQPQPPSPAPAK